MEFKIKPLPFFKIFLIIYSFVSLLGIFNFKIYSEKYETAALLTLFGVGLAGLFFGSFISNLINIKKSKYRGSFKENRFIFFIYLMNIIAFLSIVFTQIRGGGIVLLEDNTRFDSQFIVNVFVYASIILNVIYASNILLKNQPLTKKFVFFILVQSAFILSLGYRSPLIILVGCLGVVFFVIKNDHQNKLKKIFTIRNGVFFILLVYLMSSISAYRISQKYSFERYYKNIDMKYVDEKPYLKSFVPTLSLFRYNQEVVTKLIKKTKKHPLNGALFMSNFAALLPGEHLGARNIIGKLVGAIKMPNGKHWSVTPTLQGAFFVDGGYPLVFFGFFFISFILGVVQKMVVKNTTPFNITIYAFLFVSFLMSIHTGYLDLMFYLLLIGVSIFKFIITRIKSIKFVENV